ncbi:MAG: hypothetical protein P8R43_03995 [Planctomycetota bacterium]|nr:hypothetical protein [Planctomycetota bacterium]
MTQQRSAHGLRWPMRDEWSPVPAWRRYLRVGVAEEILRQIIPGDPLRLRFLAAARITAAARVLDVDRVVLRAMVRISHGAALGGPPASERWLVEEMDQAIEDTVEAGAVEVDAVGPFLKGLASGVGLESEALVRCCMAFNRRSHDERVAFWSLMLANEPLDEAARGHGVSPTELAQRSKRVLSAMLRAADGGGAS